MLVLVTNSGEKKCTSYARYLMAVKLGRYMTEDETVDHVDNDKTNDIIENLQVLSLGDNIRKRHRIHNMSLKHGTYAMYHTNKCRCDLCVEANRRMQKDSYSRHKDARNLRRREVRMAKKLERMCA